MSGFYLREPRSLDCGKEFKSMVFFLFLIRLRLYHILPEKGLKLPESEASKADLPV